MSEFDGNKLEVQQLEEIQESGEPLTEWETEFVDSVERQLMATDTWLSDSQKEILTRIHRKCCD